MRRDGLSPRGGGSLQQLDDRTHLLLEILARTPLCTWTGEFGRPAGQILGLLPGAWAPVLFTGWSRAAMAQRDQEWMIALINWALAGGPTGTRFGAETLRQLARRVDPARCARETTASRGRGDTVAHPGRDQCAALPLRHAEGAGTMTTVLAEPGNAVLRPHAEHEHQAELAALAADDDRPRPPGWRLSPWAVTTYLLGGAAPDGTAITPKYVGSRRLIEVAVATLATDRALLLLGVPGTAKTWLSEHLAAAISGDSTLMVQGTAGTAEEAVRYGWNYARLIAEGPSRDALVPSPVMRAMAGGQIARVEELTRMPSDVQDALITILSEKTLPVPELGTELQAVRGFNVIATANDRDRGVNDLSSALRRRFNTVVLPVPASAEQEVDIVTRRVAQLGRSIGLPETPHGADEIRRVVTVFRELRQGVTEDGRAKVKSPSGTLSTAEAISVVTSGLALAAHFGDGVLRPADVAGGITGAVVQDPVADRVVWQEYLETVVRDRDEWSDFYRACRDVAGWSIASRLRDPAPRARFGPVAAGRPGRAAPRRRADRGAAGSGRAGGPGGGPGHAAAGGVARLCAGRAAAGGVLAVRGVLAGVAGDQLRAERGGPGPVLRPAGRASAPAQGDREGRATAAHRSGERAGRRGRVRRPGALVGRRGGARPRGPRSSTRWPRPSRSCGPTPVQARKPGRGTRSARRTCAGCCAGRSGKASSGSRWSAAPGTCQPCGRCHRRPPTTGCCAACRR